MNLRQAWYEEWMTARRGDPVEETLARMLASWQCGEGMLPDNLGLSPQAFDNLLAYHFPHFPSQQIRHPGRTLDAQRRDEMVDLHRLLTQQRSQSSETELWLADIVVAGCLGNDHLWQDLGLWNRADLSKLMHDNFAPLARRNTGDMKWKKFLYKQLCQTEGIYTCRAPSCAVCKEYDLCFGSEEA